MGIESGWDEWGDQHLILDERASAFCRYVKNFILKGFGLAPGIGLQTIVGDLGLNVAYVNGYEVKQQNAVALGLTASATNHIFLKFTRTPDIVAGVSAISISYTVNTSGTQPADSIKLGTVTTDGVGVTAITPQNNKFKIHDAQLETDIDGNLNRITRLVINGGPAFPTVPAPLAGELFVRTDLPGDPLFRFDGDAVAWVSAGAGGGGVTKIREDGTLIESAATEIDFQDGLIADLIAAGVVKVNLDYGVTPSTILPDDVAAPGISPSVAREDHVHAIGADTPVDIAQANAEGTDATFARSDHEHSHGDQPLGDGLDHALVTPDPGGVAGFMSPADKEKLDDSGILTSTAPPQIDIGDAAVVGVSGEAARADHQHALPIPTFVSTIDPDDAPSLGVSTIPAREDHQHAIVTDAPVDVAQANVEGVSGAFSRADHVHSHGDQPIGDGLDHAIVTALFAGFMSPSMLSTLTGSALWGKMIFVDDVYGDDATALRERKDKPFKTLAAAAVATGIASGDVILLLPGTYDMAADFTIPVGVAIRGVERGTVIIQRLLTVVSATLITMGSGSSLGDVTLRLTSAVNTATLLRGVSFPGATTTTAKLRNVRVEVENVAVSVADSTDVIGVRVGSTGTPGKYHSNLEDVEILVQTKGNGKKRCLLLDTSGGVANCRNVNSLLERQGGAPGAPNYIAVEIDQVGATLYMQDGSSEISPVTAGADASQTTGSLQLSNHVLVTNNANAKGLTAYDSNHEEWSVEGAVTNGAVTRFMRPGSAPESTLEIQRRITRPIILFGIALLARLNPGVPGAQTTTVTVRKNGVDTLVLVALPDGTTTIAFTANVSVSFAEGDLLSLKIVSTGTSTATDVQATLRHY
jgi:hypothetical protein